MGYPLGITQEIKNQPYSYMAYAQQESLLENETHKILGIVEA